MLKQIILLLLTASLSQAAVYKWVDANGTIHFESSPQPNATNVEKKHYDAPAAVQQETKPDWKETYDKGMAQIQERASNYKAPAEDPRIVELQEKRVEIQTKREKHMAENKEFYDRNCAQAKKRLDAIDRKIAKDPMARVDYVVDLPMAQNDVRTFCP